MSAMRNLIFSFLFLVTVAPVIASAGETAQKGYIASTAADLIEKSIAKDWSREQVRFLAGEPELVQSFPGDVEVWRYRSPKDYLLVAFDKGKVAEVTRKSIAPVVTQPTAAVVVAAADPLTTDYYPAVGHVLGFTLGE